MSDEQLRPTYHILKGKLGDLIESAQESIDVRGHAPAGWKVECHYGGRATADYQCPSCGRGARVDTRPPPNGIDVSGEAVALGCWGPAALPDRVKRAVHRALGVLEGAVATGVVVPERCAAAARELRELL